MALKSHFSSMMLNPSRYKKRQLQWLFLLLPVLFAGRLTAQDTRIFVDAARRLNHIPATIFGSCIEDVNHEIYGGFYDQRIFGESFEAPATGIDFSKWKAYTGFWSASSGYNGGGVTVSPGVGTSRMIANNTLGVEPDQGAKLIYQPLEMTDGSITADIRFPEQRGNSGGILFRVSHAGMGDDVLNGYAINLNRETNSIELQKFGKKTAILISKPASFNPAVWNTIRIEIKGAVITAYLNHATEPALYFEDTSAPWLHGKTGLRTWRSPIQFRNIVVTNGAAAQELPLLLPANVQVSKDWDAVVPEQSTARFLVDQSTAYNGLSAQLVELTGGNQKAGLANNGLNRRGISIGKGKEYKGSVFVKGSAGISISVALESKDGNTVYAEQRIGTTASDWKELTFTLAAGNTDTAARMVLYASGNGKVWFDQASLFCPADQFHSLPIRKDIGEMMQQEGLSFLRYAGSMVNAHEYRFKNMIGPRALRPPYTGHWNAWSTNGFGIEEFLQYCDAANIASAFAINIEETPEDMRDMVEYLKGDTSTAWGRKRAHNGHPQPYKVKYIEIGNEEVIFEGDKKEVYQHYIDRFNLLYAAMHAQDTSLQFICSAWWRPESPHVATVFKALDGKAAYWDYHPWADDANAGIAIDSSITQMQRLFQSWNPNTQMKCTIFEENGGLHNMQRALGHASTLNAVRRHGDFLLSSCPANMLEPYLENENGWNQGQIFFTPSQLWGMPPFYVQQMAAANYQPWRIADSSNTKDINITSTIDEQQRSVVIHIVNTGSKAISLALVLKGFVPGKKPVKTWSITGNLDDDNGPGNLTAVATQTGSTIFKKISQEGYTVPAYSYTILRFEK